LRYWDEYREWCLKDSVVKGWYVYKTENIAMIRERQTKADQEPHLVPREPTLAGFIEFLRRKK
jgi:hypothetical protein